MALKPKYENIHQHYIDRCLRGDREAEFKLYELYFGAMYNVALRMINVPEDSEDVVQDAFVKVFGQIHTYTGEASFGAWVKRIVVNKTLDYLKRKRSAPPVDGVENLPDGMEDTGVDGVAEEETNYTVELVREALAKLPEGYRVVLSLVLFEGFDHEEVAQILGITSSTSRSQFNRAKNKLAALVREKQISGVRNK